MDSSVKIIHNIWIHLARTICQPNIKQNCLNYALGCYRLGFIGYILRSSNKNITY